MFLLSRQLQGARTVYKTLSTACIVLVVFFFNRCEYINFPGFPALYSSSTQKWELETQHNALWSTGPLLCLGGTHLVPSCKVQTWDNIPGMWCVPGLHRDPTMAELPLLSIPVLCKHTLPELCGFPGCRGYRIAGSVCVPQTLFPLHSPVEIPVEHRLLLVRIQGCQGELSLLGFDPAVWGSSSTCPCEFQHIPSLQSPGNRGCASPQEDFRSKVEDYIKRYAR